MVFSSLRVNKVVVLGGMIHVRVYEKNPGGVRIDLWRTPAWFLVRPSVILNGPRY